MKKSWLNISIEGDFVHSFLYSGTLFLIGADSAVRTYNWEALISDLLENHLEENEARGELFKFFLNSRNTAKSLYDAQEFDWWIDAKSLAAHRTGELKLLGWPADISVYSNRFYTADEHGVSETPFSYEDKLLDSTRTIKLLEDRAYSISPNSAHRVAIAAGSNGVYSAAPGYNFLPQRDLRHLLEIESYDCEWMNQILIANTEAGPYAAAFRPLPQAPRGEASREAWDEWNAARQDRPEVTTKLEGGGHEVVYSWLGGTKLFKAKQNGDIGITHLTSSESEVSSQRLNDEVVYTLPAGASLKNLLSVRSASFGSVAQSDEELLVISEFGVSHISGDCVSWRVFPRAKNYVNHLHVVHNDHLKICAFLPNQEDKNENDKDDLFAIDDADDESGLLREA